VWEWRASPGLKGYGKGKGFGKDFGKGTGFGKDFGRAKGFGEDFGKGKARGFGKDKGKGKARNYFDYYTPKVYGKAKGKVNNTSHDEHGDYWSMGGSMDSVLRLRL